MDAATIGMLIQVLGPPVAAFLVGLLSKVVSKSLSPAAQENIARALPILSGVTGMVVSAAHGDPVIGGIVGGLAATGGHQVVKQLTKSPKL